MSLSPQVIDSLRNLKIALNDAEVALNLNGDTTSDFFSNILHDLGIDYTDYNDIA